MVRIAAIESGSIAEELELEIGTRIVHINGQRVRDGIDLTFFLADPEIELEAVSPEGETVVYEVSRDPGEPLGIVPAPDTVRECANKCVFCFIDGNPPGVRDSLRLKDDDFRLSFTYGSYVTLTNLGPRGLERLVEQQLSPLYVSVHATEPRVRRRLLVSDRAGTILEDLRSLLEGGLEVHTQVVLCPDWNDGAHLDRTLDDLWALGSGVLSVSVVPVGLTRYKPEPAGPAPHPKGGAGRPGPGGAGTRARACGARRGVGGRRGRAVPDRGAGAAGRALLRRLRPGREWGGRGAPLSGRLRGRDHHRSPPAGAPHPDRHGALDGSLPAGAPPPGWRTRAAPPSRSWRWRTASSGRP